MFGARRPTNSELLFFLNFTLQVFVTMVQRYKRSDRGNYTTEVDAALHEIKGGMSVKKASTVFNIPRTTIRRRLALGGKPKGQ